MSKYAIEGLSGYPNELAHKLDTAIDALNEIAKAEGVYSRNKLTHAWNTIINMKKIAEKAIKEIQ